MQEIRARVISQERDMYTIKSDKGEKLAQVSGRFRYETQTVSDFPCTGDYVMAQWPEDDSNAVITYLFPRRTSFIRKAAGTSRQEQVVAANIDTVFVCMSLNNDFNLRRLERYLSVAWDSGAEPVVVLTKLDLCENNKELTEQAKKSAMGADVVAVSSLEGNTERVMPYIQPGKTIAFLGSSGVGKSTLINKLIGEDVIATNGLRNDDKGRHTTTHRQLITLPDGANLIDTPGMRELGMWDNTEGIETVFSDIEELVLQCRFSNCTHTNEPGCAVRKAFNDGVLTQDRWDSYIKLKTENERAAMGRRYLEVKKAKFKEISIKNKHMKDKF